MRMNEGATPPISVTNLTKAYGSVPALRGVTFELASGQIVGLLGQNGCGKTTLLKILAGALNDYSGKVLVCGETPGVTTKRRCSYLPDGGLLEKRVRVREAVGYYQDFFADFDRDKCVDMIERFGLRLDQRGTQMSKGMREKLKIALVMARQSDIYLLDEPMGGIDPAARQAILETIIAQYREQSLVVISTHQVSDVEQIIDRCLFMRGGQIHLDADVDELRSRSGMSVDQYMRQGF